MALSNFAVLDLDGTLLDTNEVDGECCVNAWREELGIDCSGVDWASFEHVTDSGIAHELLRRSGLPASPEDVSRVERRFIELLTTAAEKNPSRFQPLPGAVETIKQLPTFGWSIVIATGAWRSSAETKLRAAGNCFLGVPIASSDDSPSREKIVGHAIELAKRVHGSHQYDRIVSVGDAPWDAQTARRLGLPFLGVGRGSTRDRLLRSGAVHIIDDFSNVASVVRALGEAVVPNPL